MLCITVQNSDKDSEHFLMSDHIKYLLSATNYIDYRLLQSNTLSSTTKLELGL